jgi:hypothetical protein
MPSHFDMVFDQRDIFARRGEKQAGQCLGPDFWRFNGTLRAAELIIGFPDYVKSGGIADDFQQ